MYGRKNFTQCRFFTSLLRTPHPSLLRTPHPSLLRPRYRRLPPPRLDILVLCRGFSLAHRPPHLRRPPPRLDILVLCRGFSLAHRPVPHAVSRPSGLRAAPRGYFAKFSLIVGHFNFMPYICLIIQGTGPLPVHHLDNLTQL